MQAQSGQCKSGSSQSITIKSIQWSVLPNALFPENQVQLQCQCSAREIWCTPILHDHRQPLQEANGSCRLCQRNNACLVPVHLASPRPYRPLHSNPYFVTTFFVPSDVRPSIHLFQPFGRLLSAFSPLRFFCRSSPSTMTPVQLDCRDDGRGREGRASPRRLRRHQQSLQARSIQGRFGPDEKQIQETRGQG